MYAKIEALITHYDTTGDEAIFIQHQADNPDNPMFRVNTDNIALSIQPGHHMVFTKSVRDAFTNPELEQYLKNKGISQVDIVGFNVEMCCKCTAIGAYYRGFEVAYIADACNTTTTPEMYEMPGLDVIRLTCGFLEGSGYAQILEFDEIVTNN
ncbi:MAG: isochorismatase family protein [Defluviitaleaceae bacterium]|nr:isochorismatase family protein [Defluviitaleaceae bacterium]